MEVEFGCKTKFLGCKIGSKLLEREKKPAWEGDPEIVT